MAETALIVTGGDKSQAPIIRTFNKDELVLYRVKKDDPGNKSAVQLTGCGQVIPSEEILIVHPEKRVTLQDDEIGEIWIHSPSSGQGYWNRPVESKEVFRSRLNNGSEQTYVRSGDLGFMDQGELFVTGRLKDMIIVRGVNRYPQDIEATVENCDESIRSGGTAAFAVDHWDREHLVVVCEVERRRGAEWEPLLDKIRSAVTAEHDLPPDALVLVRSSSIPKTSSGKVQRHACREQFENDTLLTVARWNARDEYDTSSTTGQTGDVAQTDGVLDQDLNSVLVRTVMDAVRTVAKERAKQLEFDTNIVVDLGLDSLERLEIARDLETTFGRSISRRNTSGNRNHTRDCQRDSGTHRIRARVTNSPDRIGTQNQSYSWENTRILLPAGQDAGVYTPAENAGDDRINGPTKPVFQRS